MTSPAAHRSTERRALLVSLVVSTVLGSGALIWGMVSGARVILFDGVSMLAGIALVAMSMLAARASSSAPSREYPFGRHAATPLAVTLQGAALLGTLVYGSADAVTVIAAGGSDADPSSVIAYGVLTTTVSLGVMLWLRRPASISALVKAELVSWRAGTLLSLVVAVGGGVALWLTSTGKGEAAALVDPILVLVACVVIAPMALKLVRDGVRELLEAAPPEPLQAEIDRIVEAVRSSHGLPEPLVRATKLGRRLYVEVDFLVPSGQWLVDQEDQVRRDITRQLETLDVQVWATVELTTDAQLMDD